MATTAEMIRSGAGQVAAGKAPSTETLDSTASNEMSSATPDNSVEVISAGESTIEDILNVSEETFKDSPEADAKSAAPTGTKPAKQATSEREVITVTDETGKRRKVEIDWSNRDKIKKDLSLSYGARKWQAERDQALKRAKELEPVHSNWQTLETAYSKGGIEGVVDLLEGRQGAFKDSVRKQLEREKFLQDASPAEIKALQDRESAEHNRRELEKIRKENEEFKKQVTEERESAELKSLESKVHPIFHKYRFADKLGDGADEHMFDEMLWNTTLKRLEPYEEQGLDISPELVEREFATVSRAIRKRIGLQAEKKAARNVEQKKQEATENVQAKVMSGYRESGTVKEARDLINSGNTKGLLKNWSKYGSLFAKK